VRGSAQLFIARAAIAAARTARPGYADNGGVRDPRGAGLLNSEDCARFGDEAPRVCEAAPRSFSAPEPRASAARRARAACNGRGGVPGAPTTAAHPLFDQFASMKRSLDGQPEG
jgi:hypothetical protein